MNDLTEKEFKEAVEWFIQHAEEYGIEVKPSPDGKGHIYLEDKEITDSMFADIFINAFELQGERAELVRKIMCKSSDASSQRTI